MFTVTLHILLVSAYCSSVTFHSLQFYDSVAMTVQLNVDSKLYWGPCIHISKAFSLCTEIGWGSYVGLCKDRQDHFIIKMTALKGTSCFCLQVIYRHCPV